MTIKDLLENNKLDIDYEISVEEFTKKYLLDYNLTKEQLKTKNEIVSLLYYGFMIAINWNIKISLEETNTFRKVMYNLRFKNIQILKERLFKDDKISIFKFRESKDSILYSDIQGVKYINTHFKDVTLYDRFISFYSLGFLIGTIYVKKRYNKIFSSTISGAKPLDKKSNEYIKIKDSTLPEFIEEFNTFVLNNKKILKLK